MQIRRKSVYQEATPVKNRTGFFLSPFLCNVKMVEEIIRQAGKGKKQQGKENRLERRKDQCIYTIHL